MMSPHEALKIIKDLKSAKWGKVREKAVRIEEMRN